MRIVEKIADLKTIIRAQKREGKTIGFVPTMGYLHKGHLSLIETSIRHNDFTVISIFVNPTQFGPNEDFDRYPRDIEGDLKKAESVGVDVVFIPAKEEMYPQGYMTYVNVEKITDSLCGKSRPGHFRGVTTIVNKLFNIVEPDRAYFGQKDAQQALVIKKMVEDLNMNVEVIVCPIVREEDGLAMSSRNAYLSDEERKSAAILYESLLEAKEMVEMGERDGKKIVGHIKNKIESKTNAEIDYIEVVKASTLENADILEGEILIALAVKFGQTRLIDNITLSC
ncbi:MAG TPA: pantoate--beta-alanine ligase [Ruminiclostridium sp.]|mgnify:CR=1 FL=1|jgi:pantoate--beta-alanine ligase|uniref:Pantothenate synthetase n=1 Tax=Acetivibrio saccincola TaxID=1677857 RepID=A0A2K9EF02_9FIRM|nr:pantoate--beta-alanine ligase [Acetivibrio saccincola]HAA42428.1 pantoate--beta-alanine ligase [Ruminiclostridium sp.]AUG57795.1 Pantothenate synthetase [Acetivibrio saccincola]NLW25835.1 pantoate--beta-alanine ligase [Acetivibrio saccincola]PQQ67680.1 pantoate--beta-alanine ligase [Acetivibrio saccincola]HOA97022.1 pantoate--beta-alanine ligase [Acetivibrio saccincola]